MAGDMVRWGVIGCGWVARDHVLPAIAAAPAAQLAAVADNSEAALAACDAAAARYRSVAALLADPAVQAVYVATPNHTHAEIVIAAAQAGKAVLCEKPMATTARDARRMVNAAEAAGVAYATAYDQRHHPAHAALGRLVAEGRLGTITQARIHYACWLPADWAADNWRVDAARAGGGAAIDLAPHGLDLLATVLGEPPVDVVARLQRRVQAYGVDDGAALLTGFASGTLATLHVGYNCPDALPRRRLELIGSRAMALAENTMGQTAGGALTLWHADGRREPVAFDTVACPFVRQMDGFSRHVLAGAYFPGTARGDLALTERLLAALDQETDKEGTHAT